MSKQLPHYLKSITFKQDYRCFKGGETFTFAPGITLLVGDQGTGKSTMLQIISHAKTHADICTLQTSSDKPTFRYFDTEKSNPRIAGYVEHVIDVVSRWKSHGQVQLAIFEQSAAEFKNELILIDEPDTALSIRSCMKLIALFKKLVANGNQVIASVHNPIVIEAVPNVLSLEHRTWVASIVFIADQKAYP